MKLIQRATLFMAGALTLGLATTAYSQTVMRNSISVAQNSHQGVGIDVLAQEVEKGTNGRIIIKNFYSGSLGGERESIESVHIHDDLWGSLEEPLIFLSFV
jgi:TRAP-type C4-dicarboxylate transport system substrate-binding protein